MFLVAVSACWVLAYDTTIRSMAGPVDNSEAVYGLAAERALLEAWLLFLASWFRTVPIWLSFVSAFAFFIYLSAALLLLCICMPLCCLGTFGILYLVLNR